MGAIKTVVSKDWYKDSEDPKKSVKKVSSFEQLKVKHKGDLPELITIKEAAVLLKCHPRTIEEWRNDGVLQFWKVMGRYFTTPEFIADFIETEIKRNG